MKKNKNIFKAVTIGNLGNKGFTLIEMLITIMIVGLIVAVLVGVFGNPLGSATTESSVSQIADQMRAIADGADYYYAKTTTEAASMADLIGGPNATLKTSPVPPPAAKSNSFTGTYAYALNTTSYTAWGSNAADTVAVLDGITDDVCQKVNEKYAGSATIYSSVQNTRDLQCIKPSGAAYATILKVLYTH